MDSILENANDDAPLAEELEAAATNRNGDNRPQDDVNDDQSLVTNEWASPSSTTKFRRTKSHTKKVLTPETLRAAPE